MEFDLILKMVVASCGHAPQEGCGLLEGDQVAIESTTAYLS